jgi:hypothetical protein
MQCTAQYHGDLDGSLIRTLSFLSTENDNQREWPGFNKTTNGQDPKSLLELRAHLTNKTGPHFLSTELCDSLTDEAIQLWHTAHHRKYEGNYQVILFSVMINNKLGIIEFIQAHEPTQWYPYHEPLYQHVTVWHDFPTDIEELDVRIVELWHAATVENPSDSKKFLQQRLDRKGLVL